MRIRRPNTCTVSRSFSRPSLVRLIVLNHSQNDTLRYQLKQFVHRVRSSVEWEGVDESIKNACDFAWDGKNQPIKRSGSGGTRDPGPPLQTPELRLSPPTPLRQTSPSASMRASSPRPPRILFSRVFVRGYRV
jgi:hypothetical protein